MTLRYFTCKTGYTRVGCCSGKCVIVVDPDTGHGSGGPPQKCISDGSEETWVDAEKTIPEDPSYYWCKRTCVAPCVLMIEKGSGLRPKTCAWTGDSEWEYQKGVGNG